MARKLIQAENISKHYQLGVVGRRTLQEDLKSWWKSQPIIAEDTESTKNIWALRDISFDVFQGEVLGLIGKNGAGKSTLLKIISRITLPTRGKISGTGRIASLLEVGTGFHGELTGRENIYLNGNILGMKKKEIDRRFDEIIDFSGVERFLDTPVKRYSSGMYVRLAFSVAAHLDPEILVIDEVLTVGDEAFQQKSMNKIKSIAQEQGKTILFVSHNSHTVRTVCSRALLLDQGSLIYSGDPETVLATYAERNRQIGNNFSALQKYPGNDKIRMLNVELIPSYSDHNKVIDVRTELRLQFDFMYANQEEGFLSVHVQLYAIGGELIFELISENLSVKQGKISGHTVIPAHFLNNNSYYISLLFVKNGVTRIFYFESCLQFDVEDYSITGDWSVKWKGILRPSFPVFLSQHG